MLMTIWSFFASLVFHFCINICDITKLAENFCCILVFVCTSNISTLVYKCSTCKDVDII